MENHNLRKIFVIFLAGITTVCTPTYHGKSDQRVENKVNEPALIQNNPNRCKRLHYDGPSEGQRCYALHEKLAKAAANEDIFQIQKALEAGAQIDGTAGDLFNPLMNAAMNGKLETVRFLLDRGANINFQYGSF